MSDTTDKELLELAAKAAGLADYTHCELVGGSPALYCHGAPLGIWAPLTDDGDALRLAVKCGLQIGSSAFTSIYAERGSLAFASENSRPDPYAATRRAIVRAAAAIGSKA